MGVNLFQYKTVTISQLFLIYPILPAYPLGSFGWDEFRRGHHSQFSQEGCVLAQPATEGAHAYSSARANSYLK